VPETAAEVEEWRARWLAFVSQNLFSYEVTGALGTTDDFRVSASSRNVGGFTLARVRTTSGASRLSRQSRQIGADSQDRICLYLPLAGLIEVEQFNRNIPYGEGQFGLVAASEPTNHTKFGNNDTLCFVMPRDFVDQRIVHTEEVCVRPLPAGDPMGSLVRDTLISFHQRAPQLDDQQFRSSAAVVGELVLLAIGGAADVLAGARSVRSANLARAKRIIRARQDDLELTIADIAKDCGFSVSYLHNLFRDDGRTVWEYVTHERLRRARAMLEFGGGVDLRVTDVALSCGYSNLSQFSTAFRRAFGVSPREVLQRG
jgi:AraC-like DNA-binding protein